MIRQSTVRRSTGSGSRSHRSRRARWRRGRRKRARPDDGDVSCAGDQSGQRNGLIYHQGAAGGANRNDDHISVAAATASGERYRGKADGPSENPNNIRYLNCHCFPQKLRRFSREAYISGAEPAAFEYKSFKPLANNTSFQNVRLTVNRKVRRGSK